MDEPYRNRSAADASLNRAGSGRDQVQQSTTESSLLDSSLLLLSGSCIENNGDWEAQQITDGPVENGSPRATWKDPAIATFTVIEIVAALGISSALETSGIDPLAFYRIAQYSSISCSWIGILLVCRTSSSRSVLHDTKCQIAQLTILCNSGLLKLQNGRQRYHV